MTSLRPFLILGSVFSLIGCVGPKFMSNSDGQHKRIIPVPKQQSVVILPFNDAGVDEKIDNQSAGTYFAGRLADKLLATGLFKQVTVSPSQSDSVALVISGSIASIGKRSWGSRALVGNAKTSFGVTGEILDHDHNQLMTFTKSRSAQGGLLGVGGWATAGSGQLVKQLADWVASDVAKVIKKEAK